MPVDYSKGKIYKIVDLDTDECYIGSTCQNTLANRLSGHVKDFKRFRNGKCNYLTSFKILENDNYDIQLIENYQCESKDELHAREGYWIKLTDCVNKYVAGRTIKQWREDNKDKINEYQKKYDNDNQDKLNEYRKEYREENKDKINEYQKDYREANKDKILEQKRKYYEANKNKILEQKKKYREAKKNKI